MNIQVHWFHIFSHHFVFLSLFILGITSLSNRFCCIQCFICYNSYQYLNHYSKNENPVVYDSDGKPYEAALHKAILVPHIYCISVAQTWYMNRKRQCLTVRSIRSLNWVAECRHILENIAKLR